MYGKEWRKNHQITTTVSRLIFTNKSVKILRTLIKIIVCFKCCTQSRVRVVKLIYVIQLSESTFITFTMNQHGKPSALWLNFPCELP